MDFDDTHFRWADAMLCQRCLRSCRFLSDEGLCEQCKAYDAIIAREELWKCRICADKYASAYSDPRDHMQLMACTPCRKVLGMRWRELRQWVQDIKTAGKLL